MSGRGNPKDDGRSKPIKIECTKEMKAIRRQETMHDRIVKGHNDFESRKEEALRRQKEEAKKARKLKKRNK